ncbi:MAG: hypothetical protein M3Q57_04290 [Pseudomonadota bacterium]|nr:hypothetical protein [Pseudomonadota bacterium]
MDRTPTYRPDAEDPFAGFLQRGLRVARRLAISFGLAVVVAIGVGAVSTDNGFVQMLVTALAIFALWLPFFFVIAGIERLFARNPKRDAIVAAPATAPDKAEAEEERVWRRLAAAAPHHADRIATLKRSIARSRLALGSAELDPDAHDVCLLIDRRLPELIERDLDDLPPDDRDRGRQIGELIDLIEQFARDCSRRNASTSPADRHSAEVLRRRFEAHLSSF